MTGNHVFAATMYGMLAGVVGTGLGGVIAYFLPRIRGNLFSGVLGFAAGIMLAVTFLELLEESLVEAGLLPTVIGLLLGLGIFFLLDWFLPHHHPVKPEKEDDKENQYLRKGLLLAVGIALHNFPEGMAIGAGYAVSTNMGLVLALVLALHDIPEGLAVAVPMQAAGQRTAGVWAAFLSGVPTGIGAFFGAYIGAISPFWLAISLSFAGGAMLYIVCDELIPDAYESGDSHFAILGIGLGLILGLLLIDM
ncbi:MAG TPA: ZIP family metal transporter [Firmicutes bacterium]|nr:ZIP family metal transporter [Bacillota bacterium]